MKHKIQAAQKFLTNTHLPGAGWAYHQRGTQAYPEPTCCGLLALQETSYPAQASLGWLESLVNAEGQLLLPQDDMPNWANTMLVITITRLSQLPDSLNATGESTCPRTVKASTKSKIAPGRQITL